MNSLKKLLILIVLLSVFKSHSQHIEIVHQRDNFKGFPEGYSFYPTPSILPLKKGYYFFLAGNKAYLINPTKDDPDWVTTAKEKADKAKGKTKLTSADPYWGGNLPEDRFILGMQRLFVGDALWMNNPLAGSLRVAQGYNSNSSSYSNEFFGDFFTWYLINDSKWVKTNSPKGFYVDASFDEMKLTSWFWPVQGPVYLNRAKLRLGETNFASKVDDVSFSYKLIVSHDGDKVALLRGTDDFLEVAVAMGIIPGKGLSKSKENMAKYYLPGNFLEKNYDESFFDAEGNFWLGFNEGGPTESFAVFNPTINPYFSLKTIGRGEPELQITRDNLKVAETNWYAGLTIDQKFLPDVEIKEVMDATGNLQISFINPKTGEILIEEKLNMPYVHKKLEYQFHRNPLSNEFYIVVPKEGYVVASYQKAFEKIISEHPELVFEFDASLAPKTEKDTVFLNDGSVLSGHVKYGYRDGVWNLVKPDGSGEIWLYELGFRVDDEYAELMKPLKEKYDIQRNALFARNLKELYDAYQETVRNKAAFTKAFNYAAGSYLGNEIGTKYLNMDATTAMSFGRAVLNDLSTGEVNDLTKFMNSYAQTSFSTSQQLNVGSRANKAFDKGQLTGNWISASRNIEVSFESGGGGRLIYKNVGSACGGDQVIEFGWTANSNSITLDYSSMTICGEKVNTPKSDGPKSYSLAGNSLSWVGTTWTRN